MGSYDLVILVLSFSFVFAFTSGEPPRLNKGALSNVSAIEGTFQVFTCSINSGTVPVKFTYLLNGNPIAEDSSGVKIDNVNSKVSMLTLQQIRRSDGGVYSCLVNNSFGSDSAIWSLTVNGNVALSALKCR